MVFVIPPVNRALIGLFWFFGKVGAIVYAIIWFRPTWPRFRYNQLMNVGWKRLIPLGMAAVLVNAVVGMVKGGYGVTRLPAAEGAGTARCS